ncbi:FGGY-family carbohydrate kinase [Streptomyces sp. NPDC002851]
MSELVREDIWLGLDLGTQSTRCVAVDSEGQVLAAATRPLSSSRDGDRHEQDPRQWWSALAEACREVMTAVDPKDVRGLAVDATSGTILLADAAGTPLTPAIMYDDSRATTQAQRVNAAGSALWQQLGYRSMQPTWALPKLLWLLEHSAAGATSGAASGVRLLHQADLITWRLAGEQVAADASHALKSGYHLIEERWPDEILTSLDVPTGLLPPVVRPGTTLGAVCAAATQDTGIPEGTPIIAGMTDGCAAQISAGALTPGAWNSVLGTTLVLKGVSPHLVQDPQGVVYCHRGPDDMWLPGGASSSGAGILTQRFPGADLNDLTARAAAHAASRAASRGSDAIAYPLVSRGERFPFRAPEARPFILGDPVGQAEQFHACLLGVACLERLCFDYLDHLGAPVDGPLTLTGGGSRNPYWSQLRADVMGRPVLLPKEAESALGMAVLAATSSGAPLHQAAAAMVRIDRQLTPDAERSARYTPLYLGFVKELTQRGWLDPAVADHAHGKATT